MSDSEFLDDTEQNVSESHSKLLEAVSQLDKGQRVKKAERSEPTLEVSEFHLVKSGVSDSDAVIVKDLAKALGKKSHHLEIVRNLESTRKKINILEKPLEKPAAERIKRVVGFENTKKELKKWNAVITKNRAAESLHFPLNNPSVRLEPSNQFVKRFRIQSDLEKELAALEPQKENIKETNDDFSLTMNEIIMKRKEAAKIRAQQSYREAKSRRQNKIKSKKFHRVQRKEKVKLQLKEFDELKKTNPEAALEKLEQLDRIRAEERMSLRHKSTGKWAQSKQIRAKYDKETQQELAQQLSIGRELTQKSREINDSEEENEIDDSPVQSTATDAENPWVQNVKTDSEIDDFIKSYRNYWDKENNQLANQSIKVNNKNKSDNQDTKTSTGNLGSTFVFEDKHNNNNDTESFEVKNNKEHSKIEESKNENKTHILGKRDTKRVSLDDEKKLNKRIKLQKKGLEKIIATSTWSVESVERNVQTKCSPSSNVSNQEKISKIFNAMEERMQDQIKSKIQHITEKYEQVIKKPKHKNNRIKAEKDNFDGLEMQTTNKRVIIDSSLHEDVNENDLDKNTNLENTRNINYSNSLSVNKVNKSETEIDPSKYMNVKPKHLHTDLPTDITGGDDVLDDSENEDERHNVISEAFADDDVVEEFRNEKKEWVKDSQPKDIDLTLPGWGSWGGTNVKVSNRKTKRFILKFPKDAPRRDENKGNVIIFEDSKAKIRQHQISELPYPFTSVKDYEASIRMPIGRNFVPENAHRKLIEPTVKTKMGKVIEPMTEDVLVKTAEKKFKNPIAKRRNKIIKKKGIK
ncbi:U3 small nucleolar RNA-associated protein 14 homolog A isoform X2 [Nomia melanderi]|uniref:U3 small nucleolar RNA-associated protein 14 homolog A isoform X2 n=1 Tax=Nomia melanderi TaxID=2448451 RepID=UPI0013043B86|nr:U3 small nucleolar RNA-associated protein 14 homolog A [Nomia melanderi]